MSKVYVVQNPHHIPNGGATLVPKFDFSSAEQYGELEYLLRPNARPWGELLPTIVHELHCKLSNMTSEDHLLLVGNPVLIGMAVAIAANYTDGKLRLLQWHGHRESYTPVAVDLKQ